MVTYRTPSRGEIARAVGDNPDMVRALEKVFEYSSDTAPSNFTSVEVTPGAASANELAERIDALSSLVMMAGSNQLGEVLIALESLREMALTMPAFPNDEGSVDSLHPPSAFDGGANGTFTTSDPFTVTVVNGVITNIA